MAVEPTNQTCPGLTSPPGKQQSSELPSRLWGLWPKPQALSTQRYPSPCS